MAPPVLKRMLPISKVLEPPNHKLTESGGLACSNMECLVVKSADQELQEQRSERAKGGERKASNRIAYDTEEQRNRSKTTIDKNK